MRARFVVVAAMVFALLISRSAFAKKKAEAKSIVIWVEGPDAERIRNMLSDDAPDGVTVVDNDQAKSILTKAGAKPPLQKQLDSGKQRPKLFDKLAKAAGGAKVDAFLFGSSKKAKGGNIVHLWMVGSDGSTSIDSDVALSKKKKDKDVEDAKLLGDAVNEPLKSLVPPPEPEPEPAKADEETKPAAEEDETKKDEPEEESSPSTRKKHVAVTELLEVYGGADIGMRKLSFDNRQTANIRGYSVTGAPGVFVGAELYPGAGGKGIFRDIGLYFDYAQAIGLKSAPSGGDNLSTTWNRWEFGLRARFRTGDTTSPVIGLNVGYGAENFSIDASGTLADQTPNAAYRFVRLGLDTRIPLGVAAILGGADFLVLSSSGDTGDRFTGTKVSGLAAHLGLGLTISEGFEARLVGRYTHFSYAFSPNPGDVYVADGASDTLASLMIGIAYVY